MPPCERHSTPASASRKAQCQRRFLRLRFAPDFFMGAARRFWLDLGAGAPASPAALLAIRIDQYSQERVRPVVLELICPANMVSPGESVAMSDPIVIAVT